VAKIKEIVDDLELWSFDIDRFKEEYQTITHSADVAKSVADFDRGDVEEVLNDAADLSLFTKSFNCITLELDDGSTLGIKNTDITAWHGSFDVDSWIVAINGRHLFISIENIGGQAGSFAIYDHEDKKWIFSHHDECFCVSQCAWIAEYNGFIIFSEWYNYCNAGDDCYFIPLSGDIFCLDSFTAEELNFENLTMTVLDNVFKTDYKSNVDLCLGIDGDERFILAYKSNDKDIGLRDKAFVVDVFKLNGKVSL
jgi:hypothetical protein